MEPHYPLEVFVCPSCFLVQLEEFELAENIFSADYAYFSSYSKSWLDHCRRYVDMATRRFGLDGNSFVLEIASNDGYLLQYFVQKGVPVLGIEPAEGAARVAIDKGIPTEVCFFNAAYARKMKRRADLIVGNNVLAHNPRLLDFVEGLGTALGPQGVITLEFPHLLRLMEETQFDTIYHEHFSYFSLHSVERLFSSLGLRVFDVEELPTHGGSLRLYACHEGARWETSPAVRSLLEKEGRWGLLDLGTYGAFGEKVRAVKRRLLEFLIAAKNEGKTVVGYGAPAKGNTLLNYCGIRTDFIDYTVDRSPHKQGRFLPGTQIPIYAPERIFQDRPDYVLILPWNIKQEIMEQMKDIRNWGGRFVIPVPEVEVL